ncbi:hypothetical protein HMPREF9080_00094 [Cardiobacterium valvarum F0432]|uniref:Uncharacterized protein n=1 Tax=Cardiobacterium valvarum F0432 TaxID=797473 RepID=G9ZBH1_9GAMM|nr:hypothetical protein HMPREF9080_00094 [Cardiobacterium valvarum F0432]
MASQKIPAAAGFFHELTLGKTTVCPLDESSGYRRPGRRNLILALRCWDI